MGKIFMTDELFFGADGEIVAIFIACVKKWHMLLLPLPQKKKINYGERFI